MNATSPSPLVPQGAIPPKDTSRSKRVLMVATMVVGLHVAGLSVVLFQGCGKDSTKGGTASAADTNTTASTMSYPADTNSAPMFTSATNVAVTNVAHANTNFAAPPGAFGGPTGTPGVGSNLAGTADTGIAAPVVDTAPPPGNYKDYKIQKGDLLSTIATKNGVTIGAILKANPNLDPKKLRIGQTIKLPAPAPAAAATATVAGTASTPPTGALGSTPGATTGTASGTYKVKPGDTLTKIARAHGITVNQLRAANNMKTTQVQVGKVLKIPARTQKTAAANTNTTLH
ncbi:MAG TPA: LysM peptidoglycan-binding domain-containing protein [Verrucomicrobiae bacterium]